MTTLAKEGAADLSEEAAPHLDEANRLLAQFETTNVGPLDESARNAMQALMQAVQALTVACRQELEQMSDERASLRQGERALKGYAALGGSRESRFLNDQG